MNSEKIEAGMKLILQGLDCDLRDPNFEDTPARYAKSLRQIFGGSQEKTWNDFQETYSDLILLRNHVVHTLCPHHMLPVRMEVCIAYIPNGRVIGLSKLARVMHEINRAPLLQEAFTYQVLDLLLNLTGAQSGACLVQGEHGCMRIRGVKTDGDVITSSFKGEFLEPLRQQQFFQLIGRR